MICENETLAFVLDQVESLDRAALNNDFAKETSDAQKSFLDIINSALYDEGRSRLMVFDDTVVLLTDRV